MRRRARVLVVAATVWATAGFGASGFSSAAFTSRTASTGSVGAALDWTPPTVSLVNPASPVTGTVTLTAQASDAETGVASVDVEYRPSGATSWLTVCTRSVAPYTCDWNTGSLAAGGYELRARATDNAGYSTATTPVAVTVSHDTTPPAGYDVDTTNAGIVGDPEGGDTLVFTYTERIDLTTVTAGWTGGALPVTVEAIAGDKAKNIDDYLQVRLPSGGAVNLGRVDLVEDYVSGNGTVVAFGATMTTGTTLVNGVTATTVTLVFGPVPDGMKTVTKDVTFVWTPSASVKDLAGNACSTAQVTERGPLDKNF